MSGVFSGYMAYLVDGFASKEGLAGPLLTQADENDKNGDEALEDTPCARAKRCSSSVRNCKVL